MSFRSARVFYLFPPKVLESWQEQLTQMDFALVYMSSLADLQWYGVLREGEMAQLGKHWEEELDKERDLSGVRAAYAWSIIYLHEQSLNNLL